MAAAPYDAREVSNFIIKIARSANVSVTQMSLLKIVFYAHGWYLAAHDTPLVKQPVEAWEYGPVIKVVRDAFKDYGKRPIDQFAQRLELSTGELVEVGAKLRPEDEQFVRSVFAAYCKHSAFELSDMTHEEGTPWDKVWNSSDAVGRLGLRIKNSEIRDYFLLMKERGTLH